MIFLFNNKISKISTSESANSIRKSIQFAQRLFHQVIPNQEPPCSLSDRWRGGTSSQATEGRLAPPPIAPTNRDAIGHSTPWLPPSSRFSLSVSSNHLNQCSSPVIHSSISLFFTSPTFSQYFSFSPKINNDINHTISVIIIIFFFIQKSFVKLNKIIVVNLIQCELTSVVECQNGKMLMITWCEEENVQREENRGWRRRLIIFMDQRWSVICSTKESQDSMINKKGSSTFW